MKKIVLIIITIFAVAVILELGLRLGELGTRYFSAGKENTNREAALRKGAYKILCLGDSATADQYPALLEEELNSKNTGIRFSVIDKGRVGANMNNILLDLDKNLDRYKPDMVITMIGGLDERNDVVAYEYEEAGSGLRKLRIYKFMKLIKLHAGNKIKDIKSTLKKAGENIKACKLYKIKASGSGQSAASGVLENEAWYVEQGRYHLDRKEYEAAENMYKKAIDKKPDYDQGYLGLSDCYWQEKRYDDAEKMCKKGIELNPKQEWGYIKLGDRYLEQKRYKEASELYGRVIELNPKNEKANMNLGDCSREMGRPEEALMLYRREIELNPKNELGYMKSGDCCLELGRYKEAESFFREAKTIAPKNEQGYMNLGYCYQRIKKYKEAGELFKKAIELNPGNEQGYNNLGDCYKQLKAYKEAERVYKRSIELNPGQERAFDSLAALYESENKYNEAAGILKEKMEHKSKADGMIGERFNYVKEDKEIGVKYKKIKYEAELSSVGPGTIYNYKRLRNILKERNITYVCVQYPLSRLEDLKIIFKDDKDIVFVDNEKIFKEAVEKEGYNKYFRNEQSEGFRHCTAKGNLLLAGNIADTIIKEVFSSRSPR